MAHKTITISEEAYEAIARLKKDRESFTDAILRLTSRRGSASALLEFVERLPPSEDLAEGIEVAMERTRKSELKKVRLG